MEKKKSKKKEGMTSAPAPGGKKFTVETIVSVCVCVD